MEEPLPDLSEVNTLPSMTVPDDAMSIPEIIARFTRTGLLPGSVLRDDEGDNEPFEPGFDPLDHRKEEFMPKREKTPQKEKETPSQPSEPSGEETKSE